MMKLSVTRPAENNRLIVLDDKCSGYFILLLILSKGTCTTCLWNNVETQMLHIRRHLINIQVHCEVVFWIEKLSKCVFKNPLLIGEIWGHSIRPIFNVLDFSLLKRISKLGWRCHVKNKVSLWELGQPGAVYMPAKLYPKIHIFKKTTRRLLFKSHKDANFLFPILLSLNGHDKKYNEVIL